MSTSMALLLAFISGFAYFTRRFMGDWYIERPIVLGPIVGLIMGDMQTGLLVGGTLELIFMGAQDFGGSVPPNFNIGAVLGTGLAIASGQGLETALLIAIPASLLGAFFETIAKTVSVFFINQAERYAERGDDKGISRMLHLGNFAHFLAPAIPTFLALRLGADGVKALADSVPLWLTNGMTVVGAALPALGFALLLNTLATGPMMPLFFIGFLLAAYTNFGVLGIAVLAFLVAYLIQAQRGDDTDTPVLTQTAAGGAVLEPADIRTIFKRSFALQSAFSFDRMQAIGFTWALIPFLKKTYKDRPDEYAAALKRHLTFFNTNPWLHGSVLAITADMEGRMARGEDIDVNAIQGMKSSLMGPLAGVGDALFHGTLRPITGGVAAALALQGNPVAPWLFIAVTGAVHLYVAWTVVKAGATWGERAITMLASGNVRKIMEGATMAGLMAVGALTGTWLNIKTSLSYTVEDAVVSVQSMLDGIMPKLLPLAAVLLVFWLVRKRIKTTTIMLGIFAVAMILGAVGILG